MRKKIVKSVALVLWLILIYSFSSQNGTQSSGLSNGLLTYIGSLLKVANIDSFVSNFSFLIRKTAHFTEYFILYFLTYECFKEYTNKNILIISFAFCVLCAGFDEFHQLFVSGRCGQVKDVLIDSFGSLTCCLIRYLTVKYGRKNNA